MVTLLLAALVTLTGTVQYEGDALPGVTVTLTRGAMTRTATTDEHGRYSFESVEEGSCDLRYEMGGLRTAEQRVRAGATVPPVVLESTLRSLLTGCGLRLCSSEQPARTAYDVPLCSEQEENEDALAAARQGDRYAVALLRARYAQTLSFVERHRIAAVLLDDADVREELLARAAICVRFPDEEAAEYLAWCAERQLPPDDHWWASYDAFATIAHHRHARALLLEARRSDNESIAKIAIDALQEQP